MVVKVLGRAARALGSARAMLALALLVLALPVMLSPASGSETITYGYDALGRLVQVAHTGTANNGATSSYSYDKADNRTNVTVGSGTVTLTLSPTTLPNGTVGTAYSQTITTSGGTSPYTYSVSAGGLPAGLTLSTAGLLSGTPTTAATSSFTITSTDSATHTGSRAYSITIGSSGGTCSGVTFSVANVTASEGLPLVFTITKTGSATITCSVNYATQDGTAFAGSDYTAASGTLSFTSSQTSGTVSVTTFDNGVYDVPNLNMYLNLSSPSGGATLTNTQGIGTLKEVDKNPCPLC